MTDDEIIDAVLVREGSAYTDHPADRGGPTKFGITLDTLEHWRKKPTTAEDVQALTEAEAREIYLHDYIEEPGFSRITDAPLRALVVDMGVNHGPAAGTRMLQRALGVHDDGIFGHETEAALGERASRLTRARMCREAALRYARIVQNDAKQAAFLVGWLNRVFEHVETLA